MSTTSIIPVASCLYLVDGSIGYPGGKTDLVGIFNTINAIAFPHVHKHFVVYARLVQCLGQIPFYRFFRNWGEKGVRYLLCAAPFGPFRQKVPDTFFSHPVTEEPFYIEIRDAATQQLVHVSATNTLNFPDRDKTIELALTFQGVQFPPRGVVFGRIVL